MKKITNKVLSAILVCILITSIFTSCGVSGAGLDSSQYLTKGEWFAYFASETDLQISSKSIVLDIDESYPYYDAVLAIVEREIFDAETACADLDSLVDKDTVAYTCVHYLFDAFRTGSDLKFSDEKKIMDPQAAAEAVEYGFVAPASNSKFGPDEIMDIDACKKAIATTIERVTTYEFNEEERNFEIEYKDNVYETNDEVEVISGIISDYNDYTDDTTGVTGLVNDESVSVEMLGLRASEKPSVSNIAKEGDVITVKIPTFAYERNREAYKVGNIVKLQSFEITTDLGRPVPCCFIKITAEPLFNQMKMGYILTGVLPTTEETINLVKEGQRATDNASNGKITENCGVAGVSGFQITSSGVKFTYTHHADTKIDFNNGRSDKTDPTLSGDFSFSIEVSDIKLTTTGFDTIFLDALFGSPNATVGIKYTTTINASASFPKTRLAPYNNGNGKFPSNLSRSRFTSGNGAKDIKIGKVSYAFGPLVAELGLYLQVYIDGHIEVTLRKESNTVYTITRSGIEKTFSSSEKSLEANFEVNLYAGVELRGNIHIVGFSSIPICDMKAGAGFEMQASGSFFVLTEEGTYTDKTNTNLSGDELKATVSEYKNTSFGYCLNVKLDFKIYGVIATGDCIIGKVIKIFNSNYSGLSKTVTFNIFEYHWEDGHKVPECTRKPANDKENENSEVKSGSEFIISDYRVEIPDGTCGYFYVLQVPCKEKNKEKVLKNINVKSMDTSVCTVKYYKDNNMIEVSAVGPGTTEVAITTRGFFFGESIRNNIGYVTCAITVNENKQVSFNVVEPSLKTVMI